MKYSLGISNFLEDISSLSHAIAFLYFFALITEEGSDQNHPKEKEMWKAKWLSKEALCIAEKRREAKSKGEEEIYSHMNAKFQRIARKDEKVCCLHLWVCFCFAKNIVYVILDYPYKWWCTIFVFYPSAYFTSVIYSRYCILDNFSFLMKFLI